MAYVPEIFVDHSVEFPNRRKLTAVSGQADTFDVTRAEGTVFAEGTKLDAANLNAEFGKIKTETDAINTSLTANGKKYQADYQDTKYGFTVDGTFYPFGSGAELLWTNSAPTSSFNAQTVAFDLSDYVGVAIIARHSNSVDDKQRTVSIGQVGNVNNNTLMATYSGTNMLGRKYKASTTGIVFSSAYSGNTDVGANFIIPLYIFGLKNMLGFEDYIN